ncbi:MAG: hypothetical protein KGJ90_00245 [Patescibacteria group bacterium]|nr:hypothetical protein [Patescibacteria group bacterium]
MISSPFLAYKAYLIKDNFDFNIFCFISIADIFLIYVGFFVIKTRHWHTYLPGSYTEGAYQIKQLPGRDPVKYLNNIQGMLPEPPKDDKP